MPLFDFQCQACENVFEALVRGETLPSCPECGATELERLLSLPAIRSSSTRKQALKAAQQRDRQQGAERTRERVEYESHHD